MEVATIILLKIHNYHLWHVSFDIRLMASVIELFLLELFQGIWRSYTFLLDFDLKHLRLLGKLGYYTSSLPRFKTSQSLPMWMKLFWAKVCWYIIAWVEAWVPGMPFVMKFLLNLLFFILRSLKNSIIDVLLQTQMNIFFCKNTSAHEDCQLVSCLLGNYRLKYTLIPGLVAVHRV